MLEALLAATATSGLLMLARGQRQFGEVEGDWAVGEEDEDLPCPWCYGPTSVNDERCPNCHRRFGWLTTP